MNLSPDQLRNLGLLSPIPAIVVGVILLFLGRKLFWLFVGAIGFVVGAEFAAAMFPHDPAMVVICGLVLGVIGAVLAVFLQKIAIGVGGFLAGGYFLMAALRAWAWQDPAYPWVSFLAGGIIGAMLMILVFDWALIVFSSISGAHLITHALALHASTAVIAFGILVVIGIMAQASVVAPRGSGERYRRV